MTVGKTSFPDEHLLENYQAVLEELIRAKPSAAKGKYIRTVTMASTMGPGIKVDPSRTKDLLRRRLRRPRKRADISLLHRLRPRFERVRPG